MANHKTFSYDEVQIQSPARLFCSGPSGSGKTTFIRDLLMNGNAFSKPVDRVIFCYGVYQPMYDEIKSLSHINVTFVQGLPSYVQNYLNNPEKHDLLIIDDLIEEVTDTKFFLQLYTKFSHHWNCSIITVVHNIFFKSKYLRTCTLQSTGIILFKSLRGKDQIRNLSRQIYPQCHKFLLEAFDEETAGDFKYLFVNFSPKCPEELRVRGSILPDHGNLTVYQP